MDIRRFGDCKSAIQQITNLRYTTDGSQPSALTLLKNRDAPPHCPARPSHPKRKLLRQVMPEVWECGSTPGSNERAEPPRARCNGNSSFSLNLQYAVAPFGLFGSECFQAQQNATLARRALSVMRQGGSLRIINLMTFVVAILLLAMIPAYFQFVRLSGLHFSTSFATIGVLCVLAAAAVRRA